MSREMKDSGIEWIGEIPKNWQVLHHKRIMSKTKEICDKYQGEDILSLTMRGVIKRDLENPKGKMPATFDGYQRIKQGNLLLCLFDIDVTPRCVGFIEHNGLTSPAYSQFEMKGSNNARYYDYLLRMIDNDKCFLHLAKNLRSSLTENDFGMIKTIVPPIEEQEKIAKYLDEKIYKVNTVIYETKKIIEEYKKYKQTLIMEVVTRGLDKKVELKYSGVEWIGDIPIGWKVDKIANVYKQRNDKVSDKEYTPLSVTKKGIVLQLENVAKTDNGDNRKLVKSGDFVINSRSDRRGSCGISPYDGSVSLINTVLEPIGTMNNEYYNYVFKTERFADEFYKWGHGIVDDLWSTKWDDMKSIYIPVPSIEEQQEIAGYLKEQIFRIDNMISKKELLIIELENYKKSLIYEYVTGKKEI